MTRGLIGAIAATNAMSDVYAMGGEVILCLNIAGFPEDLDTAIIAQILGGGAAKVREDRRGDCGRPHRDRSRTVLWSKRHRSDSPRKGDAQRRRTAG